MGLRKTSAEFGQRARDIQGKEVVLGARYRDTVSGFEGVATSDTRFLYGCNRVGLSGLHEGEPKDFVFDALGLEPVKGAAPRAKEPKVKRGGARPTPTRSSR